MEEGGGGGGKVKRIILKVILDFPYPYFDSGQGYISWHGSWTKKATWSTPARVLHAVVTAITSMKLSKLFSPQEFEIDEKVSD